MFLTTIIEKKLTTQEPLISTVKITNVQLNKCLFLLKFKIGE